MNELSLVFVTAAVLAAAVYAQIEIPGFVSSARAALLIRAGLVILGIVFGYVVADNFAQAQAPGALTFLAAFGSVHVPAALILFIKRLAGAGKS